MPIKQLFETSLLWQIHCDTSIHVPLQQVKRDVLATLHQLVNSPADAEFRFI